MPYPKIWPATESTQTLHGLLTPVFRINKEHVQKRDYVSKPLTDPYPVTALRRINCRDF